MDLSLLSAPERNHAREIILRCMSDRIFFIEEVFGVKSVYEDEGGVEHLVTSSETPDPA